MTSPNFADYPIPQEVKSAKYDPAPLQNPVLRGLPLSIAAALVVRVGALRSFLFRNARFDTIKDMAVLDDVPATFFPCVTPLGKTEPMLEFGAEQLSPKKRSADTHYYTIADYHELYKSGKLTPLQVVETLLGLTSAEAEEPSKYQNAWAESHGADKLALEAAKASTERYAAGKPLSVLDGVPFGAKDDMAVQGYINHRGIKYEHGNAAFKVSEESLALIIKLQESGAIVLGKNRMHEFGSDTSGFNLGQGTPTNHVNNSYYPGGSSSGAGSSISAGIVPFSVATDAGGSIRIPAMYNGIYGLKPSHHRTGTMSITTCVMGPMAANVADLTIAYRTMSQPNANCSTQSKFALSIPPSPSAKRIFGVDRTWWSHADPRVQEQCNNALDYFVKQKGYEIIDIEMPYIEEAQVAHSCICATELAEIARRIHPDPNRWQSLAGPANKLVVGLGSVTSAADYIKYNSMRTLIMRHLAFLFQKYPGLIILTPTTPYIGWPKTPGDETHGLSNGNFTIRNMLYVYLSNLTGIPSLAAPVGYVDPDQGEGKLCISLLANGEWGSEEQLLSWATDAEEYLHEAYAEGRRRPKDWADVFSLAEQQNQKQ